MRQPYLHNLFHARAGWVGWTQPGISRGLWQVENKLVNAQFQGNYRKGGLGVGRTLGACGCLKACGQGEYLSPNTPSPCQGRVGYFSGLWEHAKPGVLTPGWVLFLARRRLCMAAETTPSIVCSPWAWTQGQRLCPLLLVQCPGAREGSRHRRSRSASQAGHRSKEYGVGILVERLQNTLPSPSRVYQLSLHLISRLMETVVTLSTPKNNSVLSHWKKNKIKL